MAAVKDADGPPTGARKPGTLLELTDDSGYRVAGFRTLDEIAQAEWDGALGGAGLLHSYRFNRAVEGANLEGAALYYLIFYRDDAVVGHATLSKFALSLDVFLTGWMARAVASVRRVYRRFLVIDVLFCGVPVSLGQRNVTVVDPQHGPAVSALLAAAMERLADQEKLSHLAVKELHAPEADVFAGLEDAGYFRCLSLPYISMDVPWRSFDDFLASLRHSYRRRVRKSLKKLGQKTPLIHSVENGQMPQKRGIYRVGPDIVTADVFHRLYLKVMARAESKLEVLNAAFFSQIYTELASDIEMLALIDEGEIRSVALLARDGSTMYFLLIGQEEYIDNERDPYFNLLCAILQSAIDQGCTHLRLGQTSNWIKQQIGGQPDDLYLYFRSRNRLVHKTLLRLKDVIFPEIELKTANVFKDSPELSES